MRPRTYAEAVEELGGRPWRKLEGTEQWFLQEEKRELDTNDFRIPKRGLPIFARMGLWWLGFAVGGAVLVLVVGMLWGSRPQAPLPPRVEPLPVVVQAPPQPVVAAVTPPAPTPVKKPIVRRVKKHKNRFAKRP